MYTLCDVYQFETVLAINFNIHTLFLDSAYFDVCIFHERGTTFFLLRNGGDDDVFFFLGCEFLFIGALKRDRKQ